MSMIMNSITDSSVRLTNSSQNSTDDACIWCLNNELVGPLIAVSTGIILILSLIINFFICAYTLSHPKSLKKSSTMFLFNLALISLLMTVLFMPFMVVASAAEEWIIGQSDTERGVFCQITAFIFAYTTGISIHTLAAISFDRFLSIVKPHHHKKYMTWKVALGIVLFIWIYHVLIDSTPFFGLGDYTWSGAVGTCLPVWAGNTDYVIYFSILSTIPFTIIVVTTVWTYVFTRRFLRQDFQRRKTMTQNEQDQLKHERSVYHVRIRNLIGVFGMLLLFNIITFSPYIITSVVGLIIGLENVASEIYTTALILFLLNNVTNSIIQSYFRRDLRECIAQYSMKLPNVCKMHCLNKFRCKEASLSKVERAMPEINVPDGRHSKSDSMDKSQTHSNGIQNDITKLSVNIDESPKQQTTAAVSMETIATDLSGHNSTSHSMNSLQALNTAHDSPQQSRNDETKINVNVDYSDETQSSNLNA